MDKKKLKIVFLYEGPHKVHAEWAKAINATFIPDVDAGYKKGNNWLKRILYLFKRLFSLNQIPKDTDVLFLEGGLGFVVGFLFKKFRKGRVIMIVSDPLFYELKKQTLLAKIGYYMMKDFDGFIPTSKLMASFVPFKNKKIVYPFADVERFNKVKADLSKKNIIYVGVLNKQKGVDRVIKLFLKLQKKIPEAKLFLVGKGPLKKEIEKINNKNIILTGFTKKTENYMKECSVYINLSRFDSFGVGVIEAMAVGLIPIISKNVGAKEVVEKIDKNLVVKNEIEAEKKIISLFRDEEKLKRLMNLCKKISSEYNKKKSVVAFKKNLEYFLKNEI